MQVSEKTTKISEPLGRHTQPGIAPVTFRLPVLNAKTLCHWWGEQEKGKNGTLSHTLSYPTTKFQIPFHNNLNIF